MKLGLIDIKKAYYGIVPLTSSNAFIGTTPVVAQAVDDRLRFVADAASSFYLSQKSSNQTVAQYSTDGTNWSDIPTTSASAVQMASGDTVYIRGKLTGNNTSSAYSNFSMSGSIYANGSIMYWYDYEHPEQTTIAYNYAFFRLFYYCSYLKSAPAFPATTLKDSCYMQVFARCSNLITAPDILPATNLAEDCYKGMFIYCSNLTTAPALPATTLARSCYSSMFSGCTSLTTAPVLPATTLVDYCYSYMFEYCSKLTSAPELPATELKYGCYSNMFQYCSLLSYIKCLATDKSATQCVNDWVKSVASSGTFVKDPIASWSRGNSGIPTNWTVQDTAPQSNEIWYKSTNNSIISPNTYMMPTITSNTYSNGKGIIQYSTALTTIFDNTFYTSSNLLSVVIPNGVTSIGGQAFQECHSLLSVTIPNSVTSIGIRAFTLCESLGSVTIPSSVTSIGENAFDTLEGLTVKLESTTPLNYNELAFGEFGGGSSEGSESGSESSESGSESSESGSGRNLIILVPSSAYNAYMNSNYAVWQYYRDCIQTY